MNKHVGAGILMNQTSTMNTVTADFMSNVLQARAGQQFEVDGGPALWAGKTSKVRGIKCQSSRIFCSIGLLFLCRLCHKRGNGRGALRTLPLGVSISQK
jgi:hypothetical protein